MTTMNSKDISDRTSWRRTTLLLLSFACVSTCAKTTHESAPADGTSAVEPTPLTTTPPPVKTDKPESEALAPKQVTVSSQAEPIASAHSVGIPRPSMTSVASPGLDLTPWFAGVAAMTHFENQRWERAAAGFEAWVTQNPSDDRVPRARFLAGVARLYASQPDAAREHLVFALERLTRIENTVRLFLAEASARMNQHKDVVKYTGAVPEDYVQFHRIRWLRARALLRSGKRKAARKLYGRVLRTQTASIAVLEEAADAFRGADPAKEAIALRSIVAKAPHSKHAIRAEKRLESLPKKLRALKVEELIERVEKLISKRRYRSAARSAGLARRRSKVGSEQWCEASRLLARSFDKAKQQNRAKPVYTTAIKRCLKRETAPELLYFGGKASLATGDEKTAKRWWQTLISEHSDNRFADDALLHLAEHAKDTGKMKGADAYLRKAVDLAGDMQEKAAWIHFWTRWERGKYRLAAESAEASLNQLKTDALILSRGRLLYWHGRALERSGNHVRAALIYARMLREFPLSWYSLMADARLMQLEPKAAEDARATARAGHDARSIVEAASGTMKSPSVAAAIELTKLGLLVQVRAEIDRGRPSTPEADWLAALMYAHIGEYTKSYRIARWKRPEHTAVWPVENQVARWRLANPRPQQYREWVTSAAEANGVEEALIWAIMQTESAFKPTAVSFANAVGLMQLIEPTGQAMAKRLKVPGKVNKRRLKDPQLNIQLGTHFLKRLANRFEANPALIAAGYNAGPGRPKRWARTWGDIELDEYVERIPFRETRRYVKSVVTAWVRYRALYEDQRSSIPLKLPKV